MNVQAKQIEGVVLPTLSSMVHMKDGTTVLSDIIVPCTKNLYNKNAITRGGFYNPEGEYSINSMIYGLSDFIPVTPGNLYFNSTNGGVAYTFDGSKKFISKISWATYPWTIPDGVYYVRIQVDSESISETLMFGLGSKVPSEYYPYNCYTIDTSILKDVGSGGSSSKSPLEGLTIDFVGDSITNQATFISYMVSNYNITANKYAQNGITMQKNQIIGSRSKLESADKNADAIVILGGTNDAHYELTSSGGYKFGQIGDTTSDSFCGAIDIMCNYLLENFKGKRILICSPMTRTDTVNGVKMREQLEKYVNAEKQIVESYGLPFLDLFHSYAHYHFAGDGLHPTQESGNLYGRVMAKALENM